MGVRKVFILIIAASMIFLFVGLNFAQEETKGEASAQVQEQAPVQNQEQAPAQPTVENKTEPEIQWLWGEVVSVDAQNNTLLVKYLDYETESEKELTIASDDKTTFENVQSLLEIKPADTVSIDYTISPEGKNIAKNISIEKPEATKETPESETAPAQAPSETNTETTPQVTE